MDFERSMGFLSFLSYLVFMFKKNLGVGDVDSGDIWYFSNPELDPSPVGSGLNASLAASLSSDSNSCGLNFIRIWVKVFSF